MNRLLLLPGFVLAASSLVGQTSDEFPPLHPTPIPGAPTIGTPQLLIGDEGPLLAEQHGLAAPAIHDWNGDGRRDLLIGEFETGECWIRIYLNHGSDEAPAFSGEFSYATLADGQRMKIDSW